RFVGVSTSKPPQMLCSACLSPVVAWQGGGEDVASHRQPSPVGAFSPDLCRHLSPGET
ncbi:hypothetical protein A2U01_0097330, partial [Trifolium medium]|nr:hypothetical protein [Trifolium medium]